MSDETCVICGQPFSDDYNKFDPDAPIYANDYVVHIKCENEIFDEVIAKVDIDSDSE